MNIHVLLLSAALGVCTVSVRASNRMDCATVWFSGSDTDTGYVHCGPAYHECADNSLACCPDVAATPVQLALVIMGPISLTLTLGLLGFVIYVCITVRREDKHTASSIAKRMQVTSTQQ